MTPEEFKKAVENVEATLKKALEENNLNVTYEVKFIQYTILPTKLQLAMTVLEEEQGRIVKVYSEKNKPEVIQSVESDNVQLKEEPNDVQARAEQLKAEVDKV